MNGSNAVINLSVSHILPSLGKISQITFLMSRMTKERVAVATLSFAEILNRAFTRK
jgi:hypothetical protein